MCCEWSKLSAAADDILGQILDMEEVRVWIALELLESGVSLECITESHKALHLALIADVVASEAAMGGVGSSVAADDFLAKFGFLSI